MADGTIPISLSNASLERAVSGLGAVQSRFPQAVARAVNRTMDGLRTDAVRETHKKYFVSAKDVRASISFRKASAGNLMGVMVSRGKRHSLADYQLTPKNPKSGKKTVLKGAVKRAGGLKSLGPAFLVKRAGGRYFPFYRTGRGKYAMQSLISPSMPQIIKNEETVRAIEQGAEQRFSSRLEYEVNRMLGALQR